MSLYGAMQTSVSGLKAQSQALSIISDNIANSSTVGYKTTTASFSSLVVQQSGSSYTSGGLTVSGSQNIGQSGLIEATSSSNDLAIDGEGFFVVSDADGNLFYTRDGQLSTDSEGYLVTDNGYYVMGYSLENGGVGIAGTSNNLADLERINTSEIGGTAQASENIDISANLPADAEVGDSFTASAQIYDSLGTSHDLELTWTKADTNEWTLSVADPTDPNDGSTSTGTISGGPFTIEFNSDGTLATPSSADISITGWTSGAATSSITLALGTIGRSDGLTQSDSNSDQPAIDIDSINNDGAAYGQMSSFEIGSDGDLIANFDNGTSRNVYQIPLATFANTNGLQAESGNLYSATSDSGSVVLQAAGTSGSGTISTYALESSTVDLADEFSRMIVAQQAYSAASQVLSTCDEMLDTLIRAVA